MRNPSIILMKGNLLLFIAIFCIVNGSIIVPAPYYPSFMNQQPQYFSQYSFSGIVSNPSITNSQIDLNEYSKMLSTLSFYNPAGRTPTNFLQGTSNVIYGNLNAVKGNQNVVVGQGNLIDGSQNVLSGNLNVAVGDENKINGDLNKLTGGKNKILGNINGINGDQNVVYSGNRNVILGSGNTVF